MNKAIKNFKLVSTLFLLLLLSCGEKRASLRIAVASNFAPTLDKIAREFTKESGIPITIIPGSTGKLFAQIKQGAPFDVFLSADQERPKLLELEKLATSRFTYAIGQLALWSKYLKVNDLSILETEISHIAIANPKLAPYGKACKETLTAIKVWNKVNHKIVIGENVSQAFQFADSGNAEVAFIALSQALQAKGSYWTIPQKFHEPIKQDACIIKESKHTLAFIKFLRSDTAKEILKSSGYLNTNVK